MTCPYSILTIPPSSDALAATQTWSLTDIDIMLGNPSKKKKKCGKFHIGSAPPYDQKCGKF